MKRIENKNFTIISDNCWGQSLYDYLGLEYKTPTIGLGIGRDYLNFIKNLHQPDAFEFRGLSEENCDLLVEKKYPIAETNYAIVHFFHYKKLDSALRLFRLRTKRIKFENLYYKIDFDYFNKHDKESILLWNKLKLPNSIAFYSDDTLKYFSGYIHNGVYVAKKINNRNNHDFAYTQKYYDFIFWLNNGCPKNSLMYKIKNKLFFDDSFYKNIYKKLFLKK